MQEKITEFQLYVLRWIAKKIVRQSSEHKNNITDYYRVIYVAAKEEFTEDNKPTLDSFLQECHEESMKI